jgi:integrase
VPFIPQLATLLAEYRKTSRHGDRYKAPRKEYEADAMFALSLEDLGNRSIRPALKRAGIQWRGWHALRRGLASNLYELGCDDMIVMRILRHASVSVSRKHYIRVRDPKMEDAMLRLSKAVEESRANE